MYTIYVISDENDEKSILDSVIDKVDWEEHGFQVVGYHIDLCAAITLIQNNPPHAVMCGLRMVSIDGITFIRRLKELGVECEFILISAFADFVASREFFLLGGFDYLLRPVDSQELSNMLERLFMTLCNKHPLPFIKPKTNIKNPAFENLVEYISINFNKKHSLKSLSKTFNLSEGYICNLFAKEYDTTLVSFLTNLRMLEAVDLIIETNKSMKEIALHCGYADYFYFCRVFRNQYGISPTEYRMKHYEKISGKDTT